MSIASLQEVTSYILIGALATAAWAPFLIYVLYRMNIVVRHVLMRNRMNEEFVKIHAHKSGTPTMGGLMISVTVFVVTLLLIPQSPLRDAFLLGWALFTIYGTAEGMLVFARKVDEKFKLMQEGFAWRIGKLALLFGVVLASFTLATNVLGITSIYLLGDINIPVNPVSLVIGAFLIGMAAYGIEITDGADGLVTGQFLIAIAALIVISLASGHLELLPYLALMLGSCLVYLYFNINPARVFMGGSGTLPVAFAMVLFAIITETVVPFIILGLVFWVELFSSMIQIIAIRFFKRRVFRIAPLHHHFEAIGWPETKVVQRFWLASAICAVVAVWVFTMLN